MSGANWSTAVVLGLMIWAGNGKAEDAAPVTPPKPDAAAQNDLEARLKKEAANPTIPEGKGKARKNENKAGMELAGEGSGKYGNTLLVTGENYDANNDGDLNDAEKVKVREAFERDFAANKELKDKVMVKYDQNHDDKLTDKEKDEAVLGYIKAAEQRANERHAQFKKLDADGDGKVTAEEWAGAAEGKMKKKNKPEAGDAAKGKKREGREDKLFEHALALCDKDGDHKLDEGEWNKAVGALLDHKIETAAGGDKAEKKKNKNKV